MFLVTNENMGLCLYILSNNYDEFKTIIANLIFFRNCLIGGSYQVKISDSAIYRPNYASDYFRVPESSDEDVLPLRWVPWEVYVMVSQITRSVRVPNPEQ